MADLGWIHASEADKQTVLRGIRDGVAYGGPFHVEFHPADRCNIDCFFCSTAAIRGTDELPLDRFRELLQECRAAGTQSIRFSGGGEPLFHRKAKAMLQSAIDASLPIEDLTTNAIILGDEVAELLVRGCDQVTVSLNTADPESYAQMMQTPARNFERVLTNVGNLIAARRKAGATTPRVNLQFLVWKGNYKTIPRMYDLARELEVDTILFSGLSLLKPEQGMSEDEVREMLRMYEDVIRVDEFRHISNIGSFERDLSPELDAIIHRLAAERSAKSAISRGLSFLRRSDESFGEKLAHRRRIRERQVANRALEGLADACTIGWYSMLVRSDGSVAPCCILQYRSLGNVMRESLANVWYGEGFRRLRAELREIIAARESWTATADHKVVERICGLQGSDLCTMKTFYFASDPSFVNTLKTAFEAISGARNALPGSARANPSS